MANLVYKINVDSPCTGDQIVNKVAPTHYTGSNGDFTYAVLTRGPATAQWGIVIYDYGNPPGPCSPSRTFTQVEPNADDPTGAYQGDSPSEEAYVNDYP